MDAIEAWEVWPDHNPVVQAINLNEAPQMGLGLDLNEMPNQQEMIVDPLFPPINVGIPEPIEQTQVNENEEDEAGEEQVLIDNNEDQDHMQEAMPDVQINFLALNVTMVPLEIQEDEHMNDEGMQNQDE